MNIDIGDGCNLCNRVTAGGNGLVTTLEIHGIGSVKYIGDIRKFAKEYCEQHPVMCELVQHSITKEEEIKKLLENKKTEDKIIFRSLVIAWDGDCYILKHMRGEKGNKAKNLSYHGIHSLDVAIMRCFDIMFFNSDVNSIDEAMVEMNKIANEVKVKIAEIDWQKKDPPNVFVPKTPRRKKTPGALKVAVNLKK